MMASWRSGAVQNGMNGTGVVFSHGSSPVGGTCRARADDQGRDGGGGGEEGGG